MNVEILTFVALFNIFFWGAIHLIKRKIKKDVPERRNSVKTGGHKGVPDARATPKDYCEIGMSHCRCGWQGEYPVSGCPRCHTSFVS